MIDYFEIEKLSLSIERYRGNIDIDQIYQFAEKHIVDRIFDKTKFTIIDLRESVNLVSIAQFYGVF